MYLLSMMSAVTMVHWGKNNETETRTKEYDWAEENKLLILIYSSRFEFFAYSVCDAYCFKTGELPLIDITPTHAPNGFKYS